MGSTLDGTRKALTEGFFERMRENLEMLLGHGFDVHLTDACLEGESGVRIRLPKNGAACCLSMGAEDGPRTLIVMHLALAQRLIAMCRMTPGEPPMDLPLCDEDTQELSEIGQFLSAALGDELLGRSESAPVVTAQETLTLSDSTWSSGKDPLPAARYLMGVGTLHSGDRDPDEKDTVLLLVPEGSLRWLDAPAPTAAAETDAEEPAEEAEESAGAAPTQRTTSTRSAAAANRAVDASGMICLAPADVSDKLREILGSDLTAVEQPSELLQHIESVGTPDLLIAFVGREDGHILAILSALLRNPKLRQRPILVMLEVCTRRWVLQCGQLGLWHVIPSASSATLIKSRVARLLEHGVEYHPADAVRL